MKTMRFTTIALVAIALVLLTAGCTQPAGTPTATLTPTPASQAQVKIIYSNFGNMPTLMASKQIDAYIAWQPFVEVAPMSGFGNVLSYTGDLPPPGKWKDHPCCVLVVRNDMMDKNPKLVDAISAMTILSTQYINQHKDETGLIVADWIAGKGNFTYGNISISSEAAMSRAVYTVKYTTEPSDKWEDGVLQFMHTQRELGVLKGKLVNASDSDAKTILFDTKSYTNAQQMVNAKYITTPTPETRQLGIGYLLSDHDAALFVAVKKWQYFNDTYGIALKPHDPTQNRPDIVDLMVNNQKIAEIKLVSADFGGPLMQAASTDSIQFAIVGNPPAISYIDQGTQMKILMPVNLEGSGVVVSSGSPAKDWPGFFIWAKQRSDAGNPLVIADPGKGSIQDILIKSSLKESGLSVTEAK